MHVRPSHAVTHFLDHQLASCALVLKACTVSVQESGTTTTTAAAAAGLHFLNLGHDKPVET
jgi:hypothetical protein